MINVTCGTERENGSINYRIRFTAIDDQWHYPGHQPIHTDVGANCIRELCVPLRAGLARTGLAGPATGPNTATVALATFVAFKAVASATCQQRSRRGAFEEQLTGIGCTHSRGWLNQVKEHGRTGRDCSAARGGSTAAQYRCPKYPLRSRARRPGSARLRYPANERAWLRVPVSPATGWPSRHQAGHAVPMIGGSSSVRRASWAPPVRTKETALSQIIPLPKTRVEPVPVGSFQRGHPPGRCICDQ